MHPNKRDHCGAFRFVFMGPYLPVEGMMRRAQEAAGGVNIDFLLLDFTLAMLDIGILHG